MLLERGNVNDDSRFKLSTRTQSSLELLLHGVNNAFIERLAISFLREPNWVADGVRFVAYLQDHAAALKCHIRVLSVVDFDGTPAHISLIGYVASRFKPQALDIDVNFDDAEGPLTMLFDHASIRSSFKHVTFNVSQEATVACKRCIRKVGEVRRTGTVSEWVSLPALSARTVTLS